MIENSLIKIGDVGKPHGLAGAFFIGGRDDPLAEGIKDLWIGCSGKMQKARITKSYLASGRTVIVTNLAKDRNGVEALRGLGIFVDRSQLGVNEVTEYLWRDLVGVKVSDCVETFLGTIERVYNAGASDIMVLRSKDGSSFVEIPLVAAYVDWNQYVPRQRLKLVVRGDVFLEMWEKTST